MILIKRDHATNAEIETRSLEPEELMDLCLELAGGGWTQRQCAKATTLRDTLMAGEVVVHRPAPNTKAYNYEIKSSP
jgi:hypothetical protein